MMDNVIKLNKDNVLRLKIETNEGKETGEYLEFDLEDVQLPLRYQELIEQDKKNKMILKNKIYLIDKRQDVKGKKMLSKNEEDKFKALNDFFESEIKVYNMFLGENGVQKLLNGRKLGWNTLDEIDKIIVEQITPHLEKNMDDITKKIKEKYSMSIENKEVLKDE